jgi:hypothetical protein
MGFLSALGKIGSIAAPLIAAPFTGGLSMAALPGMIGSASSVLGAQQGGKAKGAADTAGITQAQDRNALARYQQEQQGQQQAGQLDLQRKNYTDDSRARAAKQALVSSLMGGGMPRTSVNVPGIQAASVSGGMLDALKNNPEALAQLAKFKEGSQAQQNTPPSFTGGEIVKPPTMTPLPDTGSGNGFLSTLANIGQIVGSVGAGMQNKPGAPPQMPLGQGAQIPPELELGQLFNPADPRFAANQNVRF